MQGNKKQQKVQSNNQQQNQQQNQQVTEEKEPFYTVTFRKYFLHILLTDKMQYDIFIPYLKEEMFDKGIIRTIFKAIVSIRKASPNLQVVDKSLLEAEIRSMLYSSGTPVDDYLALIDELYSISLDRENIDAIITKARDWLLRQRVLDAVLKVAENLKKKKFEPEKVVSIFQKALTTKLNAESFITINDFFTLPQRIEETRNEEKLIKTGFSSVDEALQGGLGKGEIHVILGGSKAGKTSVLIQLVVNALKQGKSVVHITLELPENLIMWKYGCCFTNLTYKEVLTSRLEYMKRFKKFVKTFNPNLHIKKFPSGRTDMFVIKSFIQSLIAQKELERPDLIVIDYDDLLISTKRYKDKYEEAGQVYLDLIELAEFYECPIIVPSQTNRGGWMKAERGEIITNIDLSHSAQKRMHCDSIITLNPQSKDRMILYLDTVRFGESSKEVLIAMDLLKNRFSELKDGKPEIFMPLEYDVEQVENLNPLVVGGLTDENYDIEL